MATASEGAATVGAVSSGWAVSIIAMLTDTDHIFTQSPIFGFSIMGMLGGFAGWCLLIETGKISGARSAYLWTLLRRLALGLCIGIAGGISWASYAGENKGLWMLSVVMVAVAPVCVYRFSINMLVRFVRYRMRRLIAKG